eukprot:COSAG01_NODE_478_length_16479_cov_45.015629_7_plen_76_part_00
MTVTGTTTDATGTGTTTDATATATGTATGTGITTDATAPLIAAHRIAGDVSPARICTQTMNGPWVWRKLGLQTHI